MFGQKPNIVESRIMSTTYGFLAQIIVLIPKFTPSRKSKSLKASIGVKIALQLWLRRMIRLEWKKLESSWIINPYKQVKRVSVSSFTTLPIQTQSIRPMMPWGLPLVRSPSSHQTSQEEPTERSTSASRLVEQRSKPQQQTKPAVTRTRYIQISCVVKLKNYSVFDIRPT